MENGYGLPEQLHARRLRAPMKVLANAANVLAAFGSASVTGFINDPDIPTDTPGFDPYAAATTAQQLVDWVSDAVLQIETTNIVEGESDLGAMVLIAPRSLCIRMRQLYIDGTSDTAEATLLKNFPEIRAILPTSYLTARELEARGVKAGGTNENRFILYPFDDMALERHESIVVPLPPEYRDGRFHLPFVQAYSQTIIKQPLFMRYVDFPYNAATDG